MIYVAVLAEIIGKKLQAVKIPNICSAVESFKAKGSGVCLSIGLVSQLLSADEWHI